MPRDSIDRWAALRALDAEELRTFVAETLERLEPEVRGPIEDALLRRATARSGFRPAPPSSSIVDEVEEFAAAARTTGYADPFEVDAYLREGATASLAGEHTTARRIFDALLVPISEAEIDLGQREMVEEVLSVDLHDCVARYLLASLLETAVGSRPEAVLKATERVQGLGVLMEPVRAMEEALARNLPDRDVFLDGWIARLESSAEHAGEWESEHERWLRDAIRQREGSAGLARIARVTRRPEALSAWCKAVEEEENWRGALEAYEEAARLAVSEVWRGEFLDGSALAAAKLVRKDATKRLEAACRGAPSLPRLLRWLGAEHANAVTIRKRAMSALESKATKSSRLVAFLHVVAGNVPDAAKALKGAPGLGWSSADHPGHLLFPVFTWVLAGDAARAVSAGVVEVLKRPPRSLLETSLEPDQASARLPTPSVLDVLECVDVRRHFSEKDRVSALDAMKAAASKRAAEVTGEKRRHHYDHAATLAGCCVEIDRDGSAAWLEVLRARTSRFPAFQQALQRALAGTHAAAAIRRFSVAE